MTLASGGYIKGRADTEILGMKCEEDNFMAIMGSGQFDVQNNTKIGISMRADAMTKIYYPPDSAKRCLCNVNMKKDTTNEDCTSAVSKYDDAMEQLATAKEIVKKSCYLEDYDGDLTWNVNVTGARPKCIEIPPICIVLVASKYFKLEDKLCYTFTYSKLENITTTLCTG